MVAHAYNPTASEAETGELLEVQGLAWATVQLSQNKCESKAGRCAPSPSKSGLSYNCSD